MRNESGFVLVMEAHPVHRALLVSSLGGEVEEIVGGAKEVDAAGVARVRMVDRLIGGLVEDADPVMFFADVFTLFPVEIVENLSRSNLGRARRGIKVVVEIAVGGGDPGELPTHPLLKRDQLIQRGAGDGE